VRTGTCALCPKNIMLEKFIFIILLFACLNGCTSAGSTSAATVNTERAALETASPLTLEMLKRSGDMLSAGIDALIQEHDAGVGADVHLTFPLYVDTQQFRNTLNVANAVTGLDSTRHEFFLLTDPLKPVAGDSSVLRRYEAIVASARCQSDPNESRPGCVLLTRARDDLNTAAQPPSQFRQGWPDWRPTGANPENWAEDTTIWTPLTVENELFQLTTEYLYIRLSRGWLSDEFLITHGWFVPGECAGYISDGNHFNNRNDKEFLPQYPVGVILVRNLSLNSQGQEVFALSSTYLAGWVNKYLPLTPIYSDPCKSSCPGHATISAHCEAPSVSFLEAHAE